MAARDAATNRVELDCYLRTPHRSEKNSSVADNLDKLSIQQLYDLLEKAGFSAAYRKSKSETVQFLKDHLSKHPKSPLLAHIANPGPYQNLANHHVAQNGARVMSQQTILHQSASGNMQRLLASDGPRHIPHVYLPQQGSQPGPTSHMGYNARLPNPIQNGSNNFLFQPSGGYPRASQSLSTSQQSGHYPTNMAPLTSSAYNTVVNGARPAPFVAQNSTVQSNVATGNAGRRYPPVPQQITRDTNSRPPMRPLVTLRSQAIRVTPGSPRMVTLPMESAFTPDQQTRPTNILLVVIYRERVCWSDGSMVRLSSHQPRLQFSNCVFYDHKSKMTKPLVEPFILCADTYTNDVKQQMSTQVTIDLDDDKASAIMKCCVRESDPVEFGLQVIARFCMINPHEVNPATGLLLNNVVEDCIPPHLCISLNDQNLPLHSILPNNKPYMDGRRSPKPINLTSLLNIDTMRQATTSQRSTRTNILRVTWVHYHPLHQYYAMGVYMAFRNTYPDLARDLNSSRVLSEDYMRGIIQRRLGGKSSSGDDDVIAVTNDLNISLKCPLLQSRIRLPVRTKACTHLQSFCLYNYLTMNDQKVFWKCSLCKLPAKFEELYVDNYLLNILRNPTTAGFDHVVYRPDGTWALPTLGSDESPKTDDHSSISSHTVDKKPVVASVSKPTMPQPSPNVAEELVIDLISSDEEESSIAPSGAPNPGDLRRNSTNQPNGINGVIEPTVNRTADNNNHSKRKSLDVHGPSGIGENAYPFASPAEKRPFLAPSVDLKESFAHSLPPVTNTSSAAPTENVCIVISDSDNDEEDKEAQRGQETQPDVTSESVIVSNCTSNPEALSADISPVVNSISRLKTTPVTTMNVTATVSTSAVTSSVPLVSGDSTGASGPSPDVLAAPLSTVASAEINCMQPLFTGPSSSSSCSVTTTTTTTTPFFVTAAQPTMSAVAGGPIYALSRPPLFCELEDRSRISSWVADARRIDLALSAVKAVGMKKLTARCQRQ